MKSVKSEENIRNLVKKAPKGPGVYFWLGKDKEILYIGRATSLRSRLGQYLLKNVDSRIGEMISLATSFKFEETDSLLEAIILEAKYIKKYWPKYNVRDRDNRSFIYLVIPKVDFAKPLIVRARSLEKFQDDNSHIFGPYQSLYLLKNALKIIRRIFPYSLCQANSGKACFDYQIGLCPGTCLGIISKEDYNKNIRNICLLLDGKKKTLVKKLMKENPEKLKSLKHLQDVSLLTKASNLEDEKVFRIEAYDISHHAGKESYGSMVVFEGGEANKSEYRLFKIKEAPEADDERALLEVLLRRLKHTEWPQADLVLIDGGSPQIRFLDKELKRNNFNLNIIGISKLGGDVFVFPPGFKKEEKILVENIKGVLLKSREEAHRFANFGRKRAFRNRDFK